MDTYCTGRSEKYFKDPLKFKPERWLRENKDETHAFSHLPFGFGTRMCLGKKIKVCFSAITLHCCIFLAVFNWTSKIIRVCFGFLYFAL